MSSDLVLYEGLKGSGVVASITHGNSRVIFDFGAPFNPMTQPYDGQVEHRQKAWVKDALRLGQIPAIDGVFSEQDLGPNNKIIPFERSELQTGIIISHLHLDHMSGIGMVHPDIPVFLHQDAFHLQRLLDQVGESVGRRDFTPIQLHSPFRIGDIQITAYFSDHPCAGAVSYLIETPDAIFFYTSDIRLHGNRVNKVVEELEAAAKKKIDVLIMDATTLSPSIYMNETEEILPSLAVPVNMPTEQQVLDQLLADLLKTSGLGIFNIYHRDIEFIRELFSVAEQSNREIVFEPKTAFLVNHMLHLYPPVYIPDNLEYVGIPSEYLREVISSAPKVVISQEIYQSPQKFFLQNSYENILELFDFPPRGASYYHLNGVPLVNGSRDFQNMMRVLQLTGIRYAVFANLYCYNHAFPNNLLYFADRIQAKYLVGVHSSHPERLKQKSSQQLFPERGEIIRLEDHQLVDNDC